MATPSRSPVSTPAWTSAATTERSLKAACFLLLAAPLAYLATQLYGELVEPGSALGADPGEAVVLYLGSWSLRVLLLALSISTLARLARFSRLLRVRRMVGLFAFSYVLLHLLAYLTFLAVFDWALILEDLTKRRYITVGFLAFLLLVPLAVTSTGGWQRRLGRRWKQLHQLVYVIVALALAHVFWLTKDGYGEPLLMLGIYLLLLLERGSLRWRRG